MSESIKKGIDRAKARPCLEENESDLGVHQCTVCGNDLSRIVMNVDSSELLMESCDNCDARRWQLDGDHIDLKKALDQVQHKNRHHYGSV